MSEQVHNKPESLEQFINDGREHIANVVEAITGRRDVDPLEVFVAPPSTRANAPDPGWSAETEAIAREAGRFFGLGIETDLPSGADVEVLEGGKVWKMFAEARITNGVEFFAGSPDEPLDEEQKAFVADELKRYSAEDLERRGITRIGLPFNQYEAAELTARLQPGFEPLDEPEIVELGYDIHDDLRLVRGSTGQFIKLGTSNGQPVYHVRVDRENYVDENGKSKYRNQPKGAKLLQVVANVLTEQGDTTSSIGFVTSNAYASKAIDVTCEGLASGRRFTVGMYGRATLADVRHEGLASPTAVNQLPGELNMLAKSLNRLEKALRPAASSAEDDGETV